MEQLRNTTYASLLAALTAVGAYLSIPIGPVPIVLQSLFVYLTGLLLGWRWGMAAMTIYLLAGAVGLPVFSGGRAGIGHMIGPTGGYLLGFLPAVVIIGLVVQKTGLKVMPGILALTGATVVIYACGVIWLSIVTGMPFGRSLLVGMVPFLPGDALKIVAALFIARSLRPGTLNPASSGSR